MSNEGKNKKIIIASIFGVLLLAIIIFLSWFFNRKFDISFDLNNGTKEKIVQVKYNKTINKTDIKDKTELGQSFINWYEVIEVKEDGDILAEQPFDFNTKINKDIKLKAVYEGKVEVITIKFDSKGGSKVEDVIINKGGTLTLPKEPTYSGYKFIGWEDKNETPIYDNALLAEDTTLYAKWEEVKEEQKQEEPKKEDKKDNPKQDNSKQDNPKQDNPKQDNPKQDDKKEEKPKEVVYYCDSGYTLKGTKCVKTETKNATGKCPFGFNGGSWDNEYCTTEIDVEYEYVCEDHNNGHYKGSSAVLDEDTGKCYYIKDGRSEERYCTMHGRVYYEGYCYHASFDAKNVKYCPSGTLNSSGMCEITLKKTFSCDSGYTLEGKSCVKTITIDAKKK